MNPARFSTRELTESRQLEAWRDWYAGSYELTADDARGFAAQTAVWKLDGVGLISVSTPPHRTIRTKSIIKRDQADHWVVTIGKRATTDFMLENDQISVPAGVPFVLSLDAFSANRVDLDDRLHICIARDKFSAMAPILDAARGQAVNTPLGGVLADYMRLLERQLPNLKDEDAHRLSPAIAAMVAACLAPSADRMAAAHGQIGASLKDKARRYILRNLRSHELGPETLCRELGMSRSNVYRLLEAEGGVARYIQRLRLLESFAQLSDPSNRESIANIAGELGMADPSSFSRAFRRAFGSSPTDVREAAQAGLAPSAVHADRVERNGIVGLLSVL